MVPMNDDKFLDDLFSFLDYLIDSGHEVHIEDRSDPDHVVEHVFNADDDDDIEIDVDVDADVEIEIDDDEDDLPFDEGCPDKSCKCDNCKYFDECFADEIYPDPAYVPPMWGIPDIDRVVFNDPATIVFWEDGTKTVVKCAKDQTFERYAGFIAACAKKMFGSTSRAKAIMEECAYDQPPKVKKERAVGLREKTNPVDESTGIDHETIMEAVNEALER